MFGGAISGLVGKLAGPILDKVGLGFLTPVISGAINFFTGNYAGLIGDVMNLVGNISGSSFLQNLSQFNPLGFFGGGGGNFVSGVMDFVKGGGLSSMSNIADLLGLHKVGNMLDVVNDFASTFNTISQSRQSAHYGNLLA